MRWLIGHVCWVSTCWWWTKRRRDPMIGSCRRGPTGAIGTRSSFAAYDPRVDFEDSPELAEFRTEVRSFLDEHAELRRGDDRDWSRNGAATDPEVAEEYRRRCHEWQLTLFRNGWAGLTWPRGVRRSWAERRANQIVFNQELANYDASSGFIAASPGPRGSDPDATRLPSSRSDTWSRCCPVRRSGASCSVSPAPAPTWPRSPPGRFATATNGWSTVRRSGPRAPSTPTSGS